MIRSEDKLALRVRFERSHGGGGGAVTILEGLPACAPHYFACFLKWQVVLGQGEEKRVLCKVDATPPTD